MSIAADFFDNLDAAFEASEADTPSWEPEPGDTLKGIFLNARYVGTRYGVKAIAIVRDLKTEESVEVWLSPAVLQRKVVDSYKPAPGSPIAFRYNGKETSDKGNEYKSYSVAFPDREEGDVILGQEYWAKIMDEYKEREAAKANEKSARATAGPDEAPF